MKEHRENVDVAMETVLGEQVFNPNIHQDVDHTKYEIGHDTRGHDEIVVTVTGGQHIFYPFTKGDIDVTTVYVDCGEYVIEFEPTAKHFDSVIGTIEKTTATAELSSQHYDIIMC